MHDEWLERWQIGRTGWHEPGGNRNLRRHWNLTGRRVLVPMCGKSPDLLWLEEQGNAVVGVELAEIAVTAFFEENSLDFERIDGPLPEYRAVGRSLSLFCGDFFEFRAGPFDAHYDRGALIAVAPGLRQRYAAHTASLLDPGARQFVITIEYDQSVCDGPPYSIDPGELRQLWPRLRRQASVDDTANAPPKFLEKGLEEMHEVVWVTA